MYKLTRWSAQDRSAKVSWLLNEMNVPFEVQELEHKVHHTSSEYRRLHPLGYVPALVDLRNNRSLFEAGAICLYLAEAHGEAKMIPDAGSTSRARCYQWHVYNYATLEPGIEPYWMIDENDVEIEAKKLAIDAKVALLIKPIEKELEKSRFVAGDFISIADISLGQSIYWLRTRPFMKDFPLTQAYMEMLKTRPAAVKSEMFNSQN